jgi:hypothetical protein
MKATKIILLFLVFFFVACGYKPSAKFARNVLGEKVSTSVVIATQDPENTVLIKDAVDAALIDIFHTSLTTRDKSDSHLVIQISNPTYTPVQYDDNGFIIAYRMKISLTITRYTKTQQKTYKTYGYYDFAVAPNAVITDQERFDAINYSAQKAIASFLSEISAEGVNN